MSSRERLSINEKPVSFKPEEFDPQIAQRFLPDWELVSAGSRVAFRQDYEIAQDSQLKTKELLIDLGSHSVVVNVWNRDKDDPEVLAMLDEVSEIRLHSRFGYAWVTFKSVDRCLVFQPKNMDIAITTSEPVGYMLLR